MKGGFHGDMSRSRTLITDYSQLKGSSNLRRTEGVSRNCRRGRGAEGVCGVAGHNPVFDWLAL